MHGFWAEPEICCTLQQAPTGAMQQLTPCSYSMAYRPSAGLAQCRPRSSWHHMDPLPGSYESSSWGPGWSIALQAVRCTAVMVQRASLAQGNQVGLQAARCGRPGVGATNLLHPAAGQAGRLLKAHALQAGSHS